jgi:hypothetical protein
MREEQVEYPSTPSMAIRDFAFLLISPLHDSNDAHDVIWRQAWTITGISYRELNPFGVTNELACYRADPLA